MNGHKLPAISLFSGVGGFDLGMCESFDIRLMTDFDPCCCDVLRMNWQKAHFRNGECGGHDPDSPPDWYQDPEPVIVQADITKFTTRAMLRLARLKPGECAVVYGGPPCQGFSSIGKRDNDDPRNLLYREMVRVVREARPAFFVLENVARLATVNGGKTLKGIEDEFREVGYAVRSEVLNAADYGVPQRRRRLIMQGRRLYPTELERFWHIRYRKNLAISLPRQPELFEVL